MVRKQIPLLASIGAGILAVVLFQIYLRNERNKLYEGLTSVEVAAVNRDFPAGTLLEESHIEKKEIPQRYLHEKEVLYSEVSQVIGQPLRYPVKSGETLLWTGISGKRENTLASLLAKGNRAVTLAVDEISSVSGLILPGDRVDILGTFFGNDTGGAGKDGFDLKLGEATVMLLQNIRVLAIGTQLRSQRAGSPEENNGYASITVSVTPEEAALLVLSQQRGKLTLILRNFDDKEVLSDLPKVTYDEIKLQKNLRYLLKDRNQKIIEVPSTAR